MKKIMVFALLLLLVGVVQAIDHQIEIPEEIKQAEEFKVKHVFKQIDTTPRQEIGVAVDLGGITLLQYDFSGVDYRKTMHEVKDGVEKWTFRPQESEVTLQLTLKGNEGDYKYKTDLILPPGRILHDEKDLKIQSTPSTKLELKTLNESNATHVAPMVISDNCTESIYQSCYGEMLLDKECVNGTYVYHEVKCKDKWLPQIMVSIILLLIFGWYLFTKKNEEDMGDEEDRDQQDQIPSDMHDMPDSSETGSDNIP